MKSRFRRAMLPVALGSASAAGACNLITGEHDRFVSVDAEGGTPLDGSSPTDAANPLREGGVADAAAALLITFPQHWGSPNDAGWLVTDAGTQITSFGTAPGEGHAVIVALPQPAIPSDDYTVVGTVHAFAPAEFGILTRVQDGGAAVLFGSEFGAQPTPFVGSFQPPDWNPTKDGTGMAYDAGGERRYTLKVQAQGAVITGKLWDATEPEPDVHVSMTSPWATGRGVGFYTYGVVEVVLEDLHVTVP